jgi:hypothetical protein
MSSMNHEKVLKRKEKKLMQTRDEILALNDSISKISSKLKERRDHEKATRVSSVRLVSHATAMEVDLKKRPSDRYCDIRTYSKMDLDVWKYHEVRDWFNKDAAPEIPYKFNPSETGYTIKAD